MPKYDAFGREIGENTLSGLGGHEAAARPEPVPAEDFAEQPPAPAQPMFTGPQAGIPGVQRRNRSGLGCLIGLVILAAVVAAPIIALVSFVGTAGDEVSVLEGLTNEPGAVDEARPDEPAPPPAGITGRSLIAQPNLAKAFARLRRDDVRNVGFIRLEAQRLDAAAVRGGRRRVVQIRYDGGLSTTPPTPAGGSAAVALAALDPGAPQRLVRGSAARFGVRPAGINYLIASASPLGGGHRWIAYFKNGTYVEGDARGRVVRRIS